MEEKEEFSFMEEKVMESKKPQRMFVAGMKKSVCFGAVFGITAGVCFAIVGGTLTKKVADSPEKIQLTISTSPKQNIEATSTPMKTKKPKKQQNVVSKEISADEMQNFYRTLGKRAEQYNVSIAGISTYSEKTGIEEMPERENQISGAVVAKTKKYVMLLTSYSAINNGKKIQVTFYDGITVKGNLYNADSRLDLAIVQVALSEMPTSTKEMVKVMSFQESTALGIGDVLLTLGSPNGSMYSMEFGYVTSKCTVKNVEDYQMDVYTTDMGCYQNGYGVVCNVNGEIVGMINSKNVGEEAGTFLGISKLKPIIEELLNQASRKYAGIVAKEVPSVIQSKYSLSCGIYVTKIAETSPAFDAGILAGDVISKLGDKPVKDVVEFYNLLQQYEVGEKVNMTIVRNPFGEQQEMMVQVKVTERNDK